METDDLRWKEYLFQEHSQVQLAAWARRLNYFRFCRAYGAHSNDGDRLLVAIRIKSESELVHVFGILGIPVMRTPKDDHTEFRRFTFTVQAYPTIQQPGHVHLGDVPAHVWVQAERLEIHIADKDSPYDVTDAAVQSALVVESLLKPLADAVIDPPRDDRYCVCPRYYPELW